MNRKTFFILLTLLILSPIATADPSLVDDDGWDYIRIATPYDGPRVGEQASLCSTDSTTSSTKMRLTIGESYFIQTAVYGAATITATLVDGSGDIIAVSSDGVVSGSKAANATLIAHFNVTIAGDTGYGFILNYTSDIGGNHYFRCSGSSNVGFLANYGPGFQSTSQNGRDSLNRTFGEMKMQVPGTAGAGKPAVAWAWQTNITRIAEETILDEEVEGTEHPGWPDYKFSWTEINSPQWNTTNDGQDIAQTSEFNLDQHPTQIANGQNHLHGVYPTKVRLILDVAATCTGEVSFSWKQPSSNTITGQSWLPANEAANVTATLTVNNTGSYAMYWTPTGMYIDPASQSDAWFNNATNVYTKAGASSTNAYANTSNFTSSNYLAYSIFSETADCGNAVAVSYSGGSFGGVSQNGWSKTLSGTFSSNNEDWDGFSHTQEEWPFNTHKPTKHFNLTLSAEDSAGAYYMFIRERNLGGTLSAYTVNTSNYQNDESSESAIISAGTGIQFGNSSYRIEAVRLFYDSVPRNTSANVSIVFNTTESAGNEISVGVLQNQNISTPHIGNVSAIGGNHTNTTFSLTAYRLYSPDDYTANLNFYVRQCLEYNSLTETCTNIGTTPVTSGGYIASTSYTTQAGSWINSNGQFNLSGQGFLGPNNAQTDITIALSRAGDPTTTFIITNVTGPGTYIIPIGMAINGITETDDTAENVVTCTPNPGEFIVPDPALFACTKTFDETVFWAVFRYESSGIPVIRSSVYPMSDTAETIRYPLNGPTIGTFGVSNHTGQYILSFVDGDSNVMRTVPFVICANSTTCQATPTINSAVNSSISQQLRAQVDVLAATEDSLSEDDTSPRAKVVSFVDFAYGSWMEGCDCILELPNMYWFLIVGIMLALAAVIMRGAMTGGKEE